jgi:Holliday junction resolvasome RuvABC endonuclease subunit
MNRTNQSILALDPGTRELGYAVVAGRRLLDHGVLALRRFPKNQRLAQARTRIAALVARHHPSALIVEKTYRHPVPWLNDLHRITQSVRRMASQDRILFATYAPQAVRRVVAGNGKAKKSEVAIAVAHRFPDLRPYLEQDRRWKERYWLNMFDAVALGLHHQALSKPPSRSR